MLTPKFYLTQDSESVFVHISVRFIKLADADCHVQDDEFYFHANPYYLRLHLPGKVHDTDFDQTSSKYESDNGQLTIRLMKQIKGQHFEGLDMLTKLLTPKTKILSEIEVISSTSHHDGNPEVGEPACKLQDHESKCSSDSDSEIEWFIEQKVPEQVPLPLVAGCSYGFANRRSNVLKDLILHMSDVIDLKAPDSVSRHERRELRLEQERNSFDCEHYLGDFFDDELIRNVILQNFPKLTGDNMVSDLTETETEKLLQLPRREYIIDESEIQGTYLGLVDLIFAYAFDYRFRQGEPNVESDWTICKLSSMLSWLDSWSNLKDLLISSARRALCFPLYRHWGLVQQVLKDVRKIFKIGRTQILKCLLDMHTILSHSENKYPLNDLYVTDYCVWIQSADPKRIESIAKALADFDLRKQDLNLRLDEMENDATQLMNDIERDDNEFGTEASADVEELARKMSNVVTLGDAEDEDSDDEENSNSDSEDVSSTTGDSGNEDDKDVE